MVLHIMTARAKAGHYARALEFVGELKKLFKRSQPYALRFSEPNTLYFVSVHESVADMDAEIKSVFASPAYLELMRSYEDGIMEKSTTSQVLEEI